MPSRSRFSRPVPNAPTGRKLSNLTVRDMRGLNSTDPYAILQPYASPFLRNARMYQAETERQVSISTREGATRYSDAVGETLYDNVPVSNLIDNCDATTGWTAGNGTISLDTSVKYESTGSLKIDAVGGTNTVVFRKLNFSPTVDMSTDKGFIEFYVYFSAEVTPTTSVVFKISSDASFATNYEEWEITAPVTGTFTDTTWHKCRVDLSTSPTGSLGTINRAAIKSLGFIYQRSITQNWSNTTDLNLDYITREKTGTLSEHTISYVDWAAQKFTAGATGLLTEVELSLKKGSGTSPITVKICADASGNPGAQLAITTIDPAPITTSFTYRPAYFVEAPSLTLGTNYWIVVSIQESVGDTYILENTDLSTDAKTSVDSGKSWTARSYSFFNKTYIASTGGIKGFTRYYPTSGSPVTFFAHGTSIFSVNDNTGALTAQKTGLNVASTKVRFAQLNGAVYAANGVDQLQRSTGTTFSSVTLPVSITPSNIVTHKAKLFAVDATDKNLIRWSEENDYLNWLSTNAEYVPESNYSSPITAMVSFQDTLVIFTEDNKFVMYGDVSDDFVFRQAIGNRGAVSQEAVVVDENYVYFVADDGHLYRWNGSRDEQLSRVLQSDLDDVADFQQVRLSWWNNRIYYWFQSVGSTQYDKCFVYETRYNEWFYDTGRYISGGIALVQEDDSAIFAGSHAGILYKSTNKFSDLGRPIDFRYHTNYFDFGAPNNFKQVRRLYLQFRTSSWNGTVTIGSDTDFLNDPTTEQLSVETLGFDWGSFQWGNPNYIWGQNNQFLRHRMIVPGQATNFQVRVEKYGAETPVFFMGFSQYYRLRRPA